MNELLITGGQQRRPRTAFDHDPHWYGYGSGVVARVSDAGPQALWRYVSPPDACLPDDPILFKVGTLRDDTLYVPTQTEVLVVRVTDFAVLHRVTLPWMNDVHHVVPRSDGSLFVVNTGLDMVVRIALDGEVLDTWSVLHENPWTRFDPEKDYRFGCSTKPHVAHPNNVFFVGDEPFATRFELRDAVSLVDPGRRIDIGVQRVHDGVVHQGHIYFTTVDGHVVVVDADDLQVVQVARLDPGARDVDALGWCRGLHVEGDHAWVGFTRIRPTAFRSALSWVRAGRVEAPTRVAKYRLSDWQLLDEVDLEGIGVNAVFGVMAR